MNHAHGHQRDLVAREEHFARRLSKIMEWRRQARSYRWIADQLTGEGDPISFQRVYEIYQTALSEIKVPAVEQLRREANERLEGFLVELRGLAERHPTKLVQRDGETVEVPDTEVLADLVTRMERVQADISKLHGLNAPQEIRQEMTATIRYEVAGVDMDKL